MIRIIKYFFLAPCIFAILACSNGTDEYTLKEDILSKFEILDKNHETKIIDFSDNSSRKYLKSGWSRKEVNFTWAIGRSSEFFFYIANAAADLEMIIHCMPILTPHHYNQKIFIKINGNDAGIVSLENKWEFKEYKIILPKSVLKQGKNLVHFDYAYCTRTAESTDTKFLSVLFNSISFSNTYEQKQNYFTRKKDNAIIQYPGSYFTYAMKASKNNNLTIDYNITGDIKTLVKFTTSKNVINTKQLPLDKNHVSYNIPYSKDGMAKLDFIVLPGKKNGYIKWEHVGIYTNGENMVQSRKKSPFSIEQFTKKKKPDIIIYVIDALRSDHVGCYGYHRNTTPNIDKFAKENTLFKNAYANASWTRPSGATILTGLLSQRHKTVIKQSKLPKDLVTLPEKLKENGYYTAAFITNGNVGMEFGFDQGFDKFVHLKESLKREDIHVKSDKLNDRIFKFLDTYKETMEKKPLFLFIWSTDPHDPYTPDCSVSKSFNIDKYESLDKKYATCTNLMKKIHEYNFKQKHYVQCTDHMRKIDIGSPLWPSESQVQYLMALYDQEILFNDIAFGKLLDNLKNAKLYDDSIIILTADHGEEFKDHGWFSHGQSLYNELIKIPMIIKAANIKKRILHDNVQLADIYPTLLDILNIKLPYKIDGDSLIGDSDLKDRCIIAEEKKDGFDLKAVISGDKKLIHNIHMLPNYHLIRCNNATHELYDLNNDHKEISNIIGRNNLLGNYLSQNLKYELSDLKGSIKVKSNKATISPELDEKLRQLGYGK